MKRFNFLLATLLAIVFSNGAKAEVQSPYKVDFNTTISTSAHDFKVAPGWGHVVDSYFDSDEYETYYVQYDYLAEGGVTDGCLKVGT